MAHQILQIFSLPADNRLPLTHLSVTYRLYAYTESLKGRTPEIEEMNDGTITAKVVDEIITFAQGRLENAERTADWIICKAYALFCYSLYSDAVLEFQRAIELQPGWKLSMKLAAAYSRIDEFRTAIETVQELAVTYQNLLGSDEEYTTTYWDVLLYWVAKWAEIEKDYPLAEKTYQQIWSHVLENQAMSDSAHTTVLGMLSVLSKQSRWSEAISFLDQCSARVDGSGTSWAILLFQNYHWSSMADDFHNQLCALAKRAEKLEYITQHYRQAIAKFTSPEPIIEVYGNQYYLATLLWVFGSPAQKEDAIATFEKLAYQDADTLGSNVWLYSMRYLASAHLSKLKSAECGIQASVAPGSSHPALEGLHRLASIDLSAESVPSKNPKILLARAYQLAGDNDRARDTVREPLKQALTTAATKAPNDGFYNAAVILQAINDDDNAIAAWCQYTPKDPNEPDLDSGYDSEGDGDKTEGEDENDDDDDEEGAKDGERDQAVQGAEQDHAEQQSAAINNDAREVNGNTDEAAPSNDTSVTLSDIKDASSPKPVLAGTLSNSCDGGCGVHWTYADDIYVCKDCLDVQFCKDCYSKLKAVELDIAICSPDHEHMHVPVFEEEAWRSLTKGLCHGRRQDDVEGKLDRRDQESLAD